MYYNWLAIQNVVHIFSVVSKVYIALVLDIIIQQNANVMFYQCHSYICSFKVQTLCFSVKDFLVCIWYVSVSEQKQ